MPGEGGGSRRRGRRETERRGKDVSRTRDDRRPGPRRRPRVRGPASRQAGRLRCHSIRTLRRRGAERRRRARARSPRSKAAAHAGGRPTGCRTRSRRGRARSDDPKHRVDPRGRRVRRHGSLAARPIPSCPIAPSPSFPLAPSSTPWRRRRIVRRPLQRRHPHPPDAFLYSMWLYSMCSGPVVPTARPPPLRATLTHSMLSRTRIGPQCRTGEPFERLRLHRLRLHRAPAARRAVFGRYSPYSPTGRPRRSWCSREPMRSKRGLGRNERERQSRSIAGPTRRPGRRYSVGGWARTRARARSEIRIGPASSPSSPVKRFERSARQPARSQNTLWRMRAAISVDRVHQRLL